jgi:hypothetical protein
MDIALSPAATYNGGFLNRLRNASMSAWFHGTSGTIATTGNWTAEGVFAITTGANGAWSQTTTTPTGCRTRFGLTLTGAAGVTGLKTRFVMSATDAAAIAGQTCTFQLLIENGAGVSITPQISSKYPTAADNWASSTTDLSATNLQSVGNGASVILSYTFVVSTNAINGYEIIIDFGNNFGSSGASITLAGGFDFRVSSDAFLAIPTGYGTLAEIRDSVVDLAWCRSFYQTSYDNGVAPGTATHLGMVGGFLWSSNYYGTAVRYPVPMYSDPTISYWDGAGNASKLSSYYGASTWTDNITVTNGNITASSQGGFIFNLYNTSYNATLIHFAADATITGA